MAEPSKSKRADNPSDTVSEDFRELVERLIRSQSRTTELTTDQIILMKTLDLMQQVAGLLANREAPQDSDEPEIVLRKPTIPMTADDAAAFLGGGVTGRNVKDWCKSGQMRARKLGNLYIFDCGDYSQMPEAGSQAPKP